MRNYSTKNTISSGEMSALAILETLLSVAAYWGVAWYFDTHVHLLVSILFAPLLLLRSTESTNLGAKWFVAYWVNYPPLSRRTPIRLALVALTCTGAAIIVAWSLSDVKFESDYKYGDAAWHVLVIIVSLIVIFSLFSARNTFILISVFWVSIMSVLIVLCGYSGLLSFDSFSVPASQLGLSDFRSIEKSIEYTDKIAENITMYSVIAIGVARAFVCCICARSKENMKDGSGTILALLAFMLISNHMEIKKYDYGFILGFFGLAIGMSYTVINIYSINRKKIFAIWILYTIFAIACVILKFYGNIPAPEKLFISFSSSATIAMVFLIPSDLFGAWMRALVVRFSATLYCLLPGLQRISYNWRYTLMVLDSCFPPELVPGAEQVNDNLSFSEISKNNALSGNLSRYLDLMIFFAVLYLPSIFYRWSLKSTCWLYLPIAYLVWPSSGSADDNRVWVHQLERGSMERFRRLTACLVVLSSLITTFAFSDLAGLRNSFPRAPTLLAVVAFDLSELAPWQWGGVVSAALTLLIILPISERMEKYYILIGRPKERDVIFLRFFVRLRTVVTVSTLIVTVGFAVLALKGIDPRQLSGWLSFLNTLYGPYLLSPRN